MVQITITSVLLAGVYASRVLAAPWPVSSKHSTHSIRLTSRGLKIESFHPLSSYQTFGAGIDHPLSKRDNTSLEEFAITFIQSHLNLDPGTIVFKSGYSADTASHAYMKQTHDGIPFVNAVANVAFNSDNKVVALGHSFVQPKSMPSSTPSISMQDAISKAEAAFSGKYIDYPVSLAYVAKDDGSAALVYAVEIQNLAEDLWYQVFVDAHSGDVVSVIDFFARATYKVLPLTKQTILEGLETLTDPQDLSASPLGWHSDGVTTSNDTSGNNGISYKFATGGVNPKTTIESSPGLNFVFDADPNTDPTTAANLDTARTNGFYALNAIHDISYKYGFTETAFNFQSNNFGKGGQGGDRFRLSVQDWFGMNSAGSAILPEGRSPFTRIYLFNLTQPDRDGTMENDIIAHELAHGISLRLTGGGTASCLQTLESAGLGEGWSDAFAEWTEHKTKDVPDFVIAPYVSNNPGGIRKYPYSTSNVTNPLRYSDVKSLSEVHAIGEVWANMLHNVYAALVDARGFSTTAHTDPSGSEGNVVFLHLYIDQLALQPCNPTFQNARDAWIQVDQNRYNGANKCLLWKAFASRGLGVNSKDYVDDSSVPQGC